MSKNLVIVESPAKAKTIEKFLGSEFEVMSSYGHIRDLKDDGMGIDIENNFEPIYEISEDKQKTVRDLKKASSKADMVWLASDEDREGEAIAWHLKETLELKEDKTKRIVFNEITKTAILNAIANPRSIDMDLVNAQQARRVLDRILGFEMSPILWQKIKRGLSAGRVQSVSVRLIIEREEEIRNFKSESYFKIIANFDIPSEKQILKAELPQRFDTEEEAVKFLEDCKNATFTVSSIEKKGAKRTPAPPFTTSTLQQEAGRKLGLSVARTMQLAQNLYESGLITYMRTDSVNLSSLALSMAKEEITKLYGSQYSKTRKFQTKTKGAQEAHEAIRPTNIAYQTIDAEGSLKRLYELIWKRTIASQMADAELERTLINIDISTRKEKFSANGEVILFDGFLKVYMESTDDEQDDDMQNMLPPLKNGMMLSLRNSSATQRFTQHPARYTEASLVKKMEELGIGRPSTYASTISTILAREYVVKEDRNGTERNYTVATLEGDTITKTIKKEKIGYEKSKLFPTDIGIVTNSFLIEHFADIINYNFTATIEKDFDEIASGNKEWRNVVSSIYHPFHEVALETAKTAQRSKGERLLGVDPKTNKNVFAKIGKYGAMIQLGDSNTDEKPLFAGLKHGQSIETITLEEALDLFQLPRVVGKIGEHEVVATTGKFGDYLKFNNQNYSIPKTIDAISITIEECKNIIAQKDKAVEEKFKLMAQLPIDIGVYKDETIQGNVGRYGQYITFQSRNYSIPKSANILKFTLEEAIELIENAPEKKTKKKTTTRKK